MSTDYENVELQSSQGSILRTPIIAQMLSDPNIKRGVDCKKY